MRAFVLAPAAALLAGCAFTNGYRLDEWGSAQNCHFAHVTKKEFEMALHRVFDASAPKVYGLRPEEGGALVEQHWALDVLFKSLTGVERWRVEYAPAGDGIDAHVNVEHVQGESSSPGGNGMAPQDITANYQLLWTRIAYVLGNVPDWPRCKRPLPESELCATGSSRATPLKLARSR